MRKRPVGTGRRDDLKLGDSSQPLLTPIAEAPQVSCIDPVMIVRLEQRARKIHALGPRVLFELFAEHLAKGGDLVERIERYAALDADALAATGGDRFPPRIFEVGGEE